MLRVKSIFSACAARPRLQALLAFTFNLVYDNVVLVDTASASEIFEQMFRIDERDVCIAISFPRYSKQTINALRFISDRGATILSITDSAYSPIASFAKHLLVARSDMASFVDSLVAPLELGQCAHCGRYAQP